MSAAVELLAYGRCTVCAGIQRNDANTWDDTRWPPKFLDSGIINRLEVSHRLSCLFPLPAHYDAMSNWPDTVSI